MLHCIRKPDANSGQSEMVIGTAILRIRTFSKSSIRKIWLEAALHQDYSDEVYLNGGHKCHVRIRVQMSNMIGFGRGRICMLCTLPNVSRLLGSLVIWEVTYEVSVSCQKGYLPTTSTRGASTTAPTCWGVDGGRSLKKSVKYNC